MPAESRWAHARVMPKEMAEIELAGKTQLRRDVFDRKPIVRQQQPRLVQTRALNLFVNGPLAGFLKQGAQSRITDLADGSQFSGFPVAKRVRRNCIEHPQNRRGK